MNDAGDGTFEPAGSIDLTPVIVASTGLSSSVFSNLCRTFAVTLVVESAPTSPPFGSTTTSTHFPDCQNFLADPAAIHMDPEMKADASRS